MSTPSVDVVILTWNDADEAIGAARSALASEGVDVGVVIVDNGSEARFEPPADLAGISVVRSERNLGVGGGRNRGVAAGERPYVCFLDSDARLVPHALAQLVRPLADPAVAVVGPTYQGQAPEVSAGRAPTFRRKAARALGLTDRYRRVRRRPGQPWWDVDFVIGACQVLRREDHRAVGGVDASELFGPEDVDFCLRFRAAGRRVVQLADPCVDHVARRSARRLLTRRGLRHARAVVLHLHRHRRLRLPSPAS
jgi:hypothetical protein